MSTENKEVIRFSIFIAMLLYLSSGSVYGEYAPNILLDAELTRLLNRVSSRYGIHAPVRFYMQPYTYKDMLPYLSLVDSGRSVLSVDERLLLTKVVDRFGHRKALYRFDKLQEDLHLKINIQKSIYRQR